MKTCSRNRFDGGCFNHMTMRQIENIAAVSCAGRKEVSFLVAFSQTHVLSLRFISAICSGFYFFKNEKCGPKTRD